MPLLVTGLALLVFGLGFQRTFYGDAPLQLQSYRLGLPTGHRLHYFVTEGLAALGLGPLAAIRAASYVPAALALGLFAALLRGIQGSAAAAVVGALVLGLTPSAYFFATTIEVHGLQLLGVVVGFGAAWRVAHPRPGAGVTSFVGLGALAVLALGSTHPTNLAAGFGLLAFLWQGLRARGFSRRASAGAFGAFALVCAGLASWIIPRYLSAEAGRTPGVLFGTFAWHFDRTAPGSEVPLLLHNFKEAVLVPTGVLLVMGWVGLGVARRRAKAAVPPPAVLGAADHLALWLWTLGPAVVLIGPDFYEHGAYFLVALPALVTGAVFGARTLAPPLPVPTLVAVAVANGALAAGLVASEAPPVPAAYAPLLEGLDAVSERRGLYLARSKPEADVVERELGIPTENLRYFLMMPEEQRALFAERIAAWGAALTARGEPLYLHAEVLELAQSMPRLAAALETILAGQVQVPVAAPGFVGVRVEAATGG